VDPGFDPSHIALVGLKIGIGTGSSASYSGPIYLDALNINGLPTVSGNPPAPSCH